jgi:hypothetical protein
MRKSENHKTGIKYNPNHPIFYTSSKNNAMDQEINCISNLSFTKIHKLDFKEQQLQIKENFTLFK